jgi:hypothetical protein
MLDRVARFIGVPEGELATVPPDNFRPFVEPGLRTTVLSRTIRAGAAAGRYFDPLLWRRASRPLTAALQHGGVDKRPKLSLEQRSSLLSACDPDIILLEEVLSESFEDWRSPTGRGSFAERV